MKPSIISTFNWPMWTMLVKRSARRDGSVGFLRLAEPPVSLWECGAVPDPPCSTARLLGFQVFPTSSLKERSLVRWP